jgi:hypothetical protein
MRRSNQLHDNCDGEIESLIGHEGCYDDNYGRCMKCGIEGEIIIEDIVQGLVFVTIQPITSRHEISASDS